MTDVLQRANRDPRMYQRYIEYMDMLQDEGIEMFAHFSNCASWSKWGSWGLLEYQDQSPNQAHKFRAVQDWMANN